MSEPIGRPTAYKPEFNDQAYKLCLLGATDASLADFFGVCEATLNNWKIVHPDFLESLVRGKTVADAEIANALFHRAKGYSHDDVDIRTVSNGANMGSEIVQTDIVKHYPPDTQAATWWLKNRQPKLWKEKSEVAHDVSDDLSAVLKEARERVTNARRQPK